MMHVRPRVKPLGAVVVSIVEDYDGWATPNGIEKINPIGNELKETVS